MYEISPPLDATAALTRLIVTSRLPFSIVSDKSLKYFVDAVRSDPKWRIPHRTTLSGPELDKLYAEVTKGVKQKFDKVQYISLTVDGTTGAAGTPFWSVTVAGLDEQFVMQTAILACIPIFKSHTGHNLSSAVKDVVKSFGLDASRIVAIVTDEGGGAPLIAEHFPNASEIHCAAHLLQTALRHAFDNTDKLYPLLGSVINFAKRLASHFNQSTASRQEISALQAKLSDSVASLKQDVPTRWLSKLECLKSVLSNKAAIGI